MSGVLIGAGLAMRDKRLNLGRKAGKAEGREGAFLDWLLIIVNSCLQFGWRPDGILTVTIPKTASQT